MLVDSYKLCIFGSIEGMSKIHKISHNTFFDFFTKIPQPFSPNIKKWSNLLEFLIFEYEAIAMTVLSV